MSSHEYVARIVRLPRYMWNWLEEMAEKRNESVDDVLAWTIELLIKFHKRWSLKKQTVWTMEERILREYEKTLRSKGWSRRTISSHISIAKRFINWCGRNNIRPSIESINKFINSSNLKKSTKALYKYSLKQLLKTLLVAKIV